jgi:hypothetical protein
MDRLPLAGVLLAVSAVVSTVACGPSFKEKRTPSGDFCSDMPIVPAGQDPGREYHRLQPIQSDPKARTEAERLESLRKAACKVDGDAVIEAVNEEVRGDNAQYAMVSSGTAITWVRHTNPETTPIAINGGKKNGGGTGNPDVTVTVTGDAPAPDPSVATDVTPPPVPTTTSSAKAGAPPTAKSAKPAAGKPPKPAPKPDPKKPAPASTAAPAASP